MDITKRPTPRTDDAMEACGKLANVEQMYGYMVEFAKGLERDLDTCRDAHMANCLASDTLRNEIDSLRERLEQHRYADLEHDQLGCSVAKTGIYAERDR